MLDDNDDVQGSDNEDINNDLQSTYDEDSILKGDDNDNDVYVKIMYRSTMT